MKKYFLSGFFLRALPRRVLGHTQFSGESDKYKVSKKILARESGMHIFVTIA